MDRFPNMHVELAARIGELGASRGCPESFREYQDRILFGTDAFPMEPTRHSKSSMTSCTILLPLSETEDEYFDYAPRHTSPGRADLWAGLPDGY